MGFRLSSISSCGRVESPPKALRPYAFLRGKNEHKTQVEASPRRCPDQAAWQSLWLTKKKKIYIYIYIHILGFGLKVSGAGLQGVLGAHTFFSRCLWLAAAFPELDSLQPRIFYKSVANRDFAHQALQKVLKAGFVTACTSKGQKNHE